MFGKCGLNSLRQILIVGMMLVLVACKQQAPVVHAPAGSVQGEAAGELHIFRGIPYGQAPVRELRWRPPQEMPRWSGVRDATRFGAACVQPAPPQGALVYDPMSEDCLFLNIWAPAHAENAPVLVWIHGGSLISGAGNEAIYDGTRFAERGIVFVAINYRLGALGYLAHPELSAESDRGISGNYGLMDQIEALRWVQRNIKAFGGNPEQVTIAGQSAGALSVLFLMTSPEASGLFHGAIAQSAYMITQPELRNSSFADVPDAESLGLWVADQLGAGGLSDLRSMSAEMITEGSISAGYYPLGTIDGQLLPRQLVDVFDGGEQAAVPLLAGYTDGEIRSLPILLPPAPASAEAYISEIRARYRDLADDFLALYPAENITESMLATTRDAMYGWTAERLAMKHSAIGMSSFLYYFDHAYPATDEGGYHAFHGAEIPFVFGTMDVTPAIWPAIPNTDAEKRMSNAMLDYWATFARAGRPQAEGEAEWPVYGEDRAYMAFEDLPRGRSGLANGYELHEAVVCRRRAEGGIAWNWNVGIIAPPVPHQSEVCD